jgi:hypothetical protein
VICYQGEEVWPDNEGSPSLYSIGVSLGRVARFAGHTKYFYTVLPHVLTVAAIMPEEYAIYGLLHDAPEACVSDVPSPWKTQAAKAQESILIERIYKANGLEWPISAEAQAAVDLADHVVLVAEAHAIGHPAADPDWTGRPDVWPKEPDADAYEITLYHLDNIPQYLNAEIAGPIYEQAFVHYLDLRNACLDRENVEA